ncbi:hypothetical protein HK100_011930 [Physocladia obscura]|uniref:Uncharacterized protein n=1 Tax=Physocladia obscura TaxID=109957 RepID=A0AAD5TAT2_9FUNG|nr:hypothetical protein HK100_011930 [Physocladia obscura]
MSKLFDARLSTVTPGNRPNNDNTASSAALLSLNDGLGSGLNSMTFTMRISKETQNPLRAQTAPVSGINLNGLQNFLAAVTRSLPGTSTEVSTPWLTTAMSPATQRQNARLAAFFSTMKTSGSLAGTNTDGASISNDEIAENFDQLDQGDRATRFDRCFADILKLLEYAKSIEDIANLDLSDLSMLAAEDKRRLTRSAGGALQSTARNQQFRESAYPATDASPLPNIAVGVKNRYSRKPIKLIAAELHKRIDQLRSNQIEYQQNQVIQTNIVKLNKERMAQLFPEARLKAMEFMEQGKRREKEESGKAQLIQKKWFVIISVAARIGYMQRTLEESRNKNSKTIRDNHAARVIQKRYCRKHLAIRSAQITALLKYWDKNESLWWTQRKQHNGFNGSTASLDGDKGRSKPKKKGKKSKDDEKEKDKGDREKAVAVKVTESIKISVLTDDLLMRKKMYRKLLTAYREQLNRYHEEKKKLPLKKTMFSGIKPKAENS